MDLESLRKKIDQVDEKIVLLLEERTRCALEIGKLKGKDGGPIYSPERESEVYGRLEKLAKGPLPADALKSIYREVMSASLALEQPLTIAYLGPEATFTHIASIAKFGNSVTYRPLDTISDVFAEVGKKRADYGVIPIENSTEGAVSHSLDMFVDSDLKICSEIITNISLHLLSNSPLKSIRRVYSKPEAIGQCRQWLEANLPRVEFIDTSSTTQAAKRASSEDASAAVASKLAATYYNLPIVAEGIEDSSSNQTRFLVIGRHIAKRTGQDKTSIILSIKDKVGALYEILQPIRKNRINMTKIESRPSKQRTWDYFFFIDLEGHIQDKKVKKTLDEMESKVKFLKILGSYPIAARPK
jgi:chorismate mutase/prephenate dehydratase